MTSPLMPLLLGVALIAGAITLNVQRARIHADDVRGVRALRAELDSVRALASAATSREDSTQLAGIVARRAAMLARREFHVPSRQEAIDGWWSHRGPGTLIAACGAGLVALSLLQFRRSRPR